MEQGYGKINLRKSSSGMAEERPFVVHKWVRNVSQGERGK